ncbi:20S proteasome subunit A/B [Cyanobium sp. ATX 6A2]|uniref:20S proteasome subunit A/B n=1 Tax=Cyanobium sp. ATX 6A2 TaxID=2823700 RepID=UPI0020CE6971|nr:20S proteasome subunit A/B [Cyanobium sp. ATX 6A2]MCP9889014.1 20S proteasome subunit A/B [Cyanobium sp. ATX 6A2]
MTYCLGFLLEAGLVMASDCRTNAGVDYISSYRKMHIFRPSDDRLIVLLAAGNLATTQAVLNRIQRDLDRAQRGRGDSGEKGDKGHKGDSAAEQRRLNSLLDADYLFEVADYVGRISREVQAEIKPALSQAGASGSASFILGGQIAGQHHGLFMIYPQGNAVMATTETPFLQIGESKYGKPPLDGLANTRMSLEDAARLCLVSQVITRRSNLTVGPPFDLVILRRDELRIAQQLRLGADSDALEAFLNTWMEVQREALERLPRFPWEPQASAEAAKPAPSVSTSADPVLG